MVSSFYFNICFSDISGVAVFIVVIVSSVSASGFYFFFLYSTGYIFKNT